MGRLLEGLGLLSQFLLEPPFAGARLFRRLLAALRLPACVARACPAQRAKSNRPGSVVTRKGLSHRFWHQDRFLKALASARAKQAKRQVPNLPSQSQLPLLARPCSLPFRPRVRPRLPHWSIGTRFFLEFPAGTIPRRRPTAAGNFAVPVNKRLGWKRRGWKPPEAARRGYIFLGSGRSPGLGPEVCKGDAAGCGSPRTLLRTGADFGGARLTL